MTEGIFVEGLVYGILALGIFISFRVLDFADMTFEGSFPAGAAAAAAIVTGFGAGRGWASFLALPASFAAGGLAGLVTSLVHHKLKVPPLLAGIVSMTGFYSINLRILGGRPNLPLIKNNPVMRFAESWLGPAVPQAAAALCAAILAALAVTALLDLFFHTEAGIAMGALGDNPDSVIQAGIDPARMRTAGIVLANGLAGLSGALASAYQGFADVNFGAGIVASGLASVMLGELVVRSQFIGAQIARVIVGSILFRGLMYAGRSWGYLAGITPNDLRLLTALLIVGAVWISKRAKGVPGIAMRRNRRGGAR